ncbi:MAG: ABC transporter ATP-binding protein [candidate division NC10 bacterium]|nr:ABC transporter ATP-binding protein [candidate division NC10 bacterium]
MGEAMSLWMQRTALFLLTLAAPHLVPNDYWIGVLTRICLYTTLALGLNVVVGFAGLLDLGYVAFYGIGSYIYAFLASPHFALHLSFWVALPLTVAIAAVSGILLGAPTLRLRGDYLAIVTLGFGEIVYLLLINGDRPVNITNGVNGILGIDPPRLGSLTFSRNHEYYYLFLAFLLLALLISTRLAHSRIGWAWQAIREDEVAARVMGINTTKAKLQAFAVGASFAGIGGGLLASWQRSVFPDNFLFYESINILAMVILGGVGNLAGVVVGATLLVALPEIFRGFHRYRMLAYGLMLIVLMIFRPRGLFEGNRVGRREPETSTLEEETLSLVEPGPPVGQ